MYLGVCLGWSVGNFLSTLSAPFFASVLCTCVSMHNPLSRKGVRHVIIVAGGYAYYCCRPSSPVLLHVCFYILSTTSLPRADAIRQCSRMQFTIASMCHIAFNCHGQVRVQGNAIQLYGSANIHGQFGRFRKALRRIHWSKILHRPEISRFVQKRR